MGKTFIYHITALDNLASIIKCKGIYCKNQQPEGCRNIAYEDLQERRSSTIVPLHPGGTLHDYVPFYFAPKSPMLYAIYKGLINGYTDGQERILYIVTSVERIEEGNLDYVFTDGHAIMMLTDFFNDKTDLDKIDWEIMKSKYWHDTIEDGDRKRRRQAEFLLHQFLPITAILGIGVYDIEVKNEVDEELSRYGTQIPVKEFRDWYY